METTPNTPLLGTILVGKTTYEVYGLVTSDNCKRAGILAHYALIGPNGATYFVTDHGPKYQINSIATGGSKSQRWTPAPRPLRGLTREHFTPFVAQ